MKNAIENLGKKLKFSIVFPRKSLAGAPPQTPLGGNRPQDPRPGGQALAAPNRPPPGPPRPARSAGRAQPCSTAG